MSKLLNGTSTEDVDSIFKHMTGCTLATPWQNKRPFEETNLHMLQNEILCDVTFITGSSRREIKAHKFLLASRSPTFYTMFCCSSSETHDSIQVPDIEFDVMEEVLRYIYTEECKINLESVFAILLGAQKYGLSRLIEKCETFLTNCLSAENVFTILKNVYNAKEREIEQNCLSLILETGDKALKSDEFKALPKAVIRKIVISDDLQAEESTIYEACKKWAAEKCKQDNGNAKPTLEEPTSVQPTSVQPTSVQPTSVKHMSVLSTSVEPMSVLPTSVEPMSVQPTSVDLRKQLGDLLYLIRFPLMTFEAFASSASADDILTADEKVSIFHSIANKSSASSECKFSQKARIRSSGVIKERIIIKRFPNAPKREWMHNGPPDSISFKMSVKAKFLGVGLFSPIKAGHVKGILKLQKGTSDILFEKNVEIHYDPTKVSEEVLLDNGVDLEPGVLYTIHSKFTGCYTYYGTGGQTTVSEGNINVSFIGNDFSPNGTDTNEGQFPYIILQTNER